MEEIKFHEDLKQCAIFSYGKTQALPSGYRCTKSKHDVLTGFQAKVIDNGQGIIIVYTGTNSPLDLFHSDVPMWMKILPIQYPEAARLYERVRRQYPSSKIILTGHSLGGSLAQIVGALYDVETVTFNAYGVKNIIKTNQTIYFDKITNYVNLNDFKFMTDNTENQIGTCYSVGSRGGGANNHEAETMMPLKTRKKFNQEDYGKHHTSPYKTPKEVHTGRESCAGIYSVSGYTKGDGTEVSGYKRECYIHGPNAVKSYFGKAIKEMTNEEINELLDDYI